MTSEQKETKNLTREDLKTIAPGETKVFNVPSIQACFSGKSLAYQTQHLLGCKFKVSVNFALKQLTVQRNEL